jgi:crotonobetainyl-CoA:carnitine CoA-transferase CaiB-like acyl-CoA transferase
MRKFLEGCKVLDLTQIGAGPTCTMLLADFGAEVIKIEPVKGDIGRTLGPPWYGEESPIQVAFNRGKKSVAVNLKSAEGAELVRKLAVQCDFFVESFRPGTLAKFGLAAPQLREMKPSLIYCSVSGYGQSGPYAAHAGVDGIIQAASGLMGLIGVEGQQPCKVQAPIVDVFTGYVAALGAVTALAHRMQTGEGAHIDSSLFASALALQQPAITSFFGTGNEPEKMGSAAPYSSPNEAYPTKDGWIMIAAYMPERWVRFCAIIGRKDLSDEPRFATSSNRVVYRSDLFEEIAEAMASKTTKEWIPLLEDSDILCSAVATYADVVSHPQAQFAHLITEQVHPILGAFKTPGNPINPHETNAEAFEAQPMLGEHTGEVLRQLGLSTSEIETLVSRGAVAHASERAQLKSGIR